MRTFKLRNLYAVIFALICALSLAICSYTLSSSFAKTAGDGNEVITTPEIVILHDNAEKEGIVLEENGKERLTSMVNGLTNYQRNWQILIPNTNKWVNVHAKTAQSIDVTYSLIGSMLNDSGRAYLRLAVQSGSDVYVSKGVEVALSYSVSNENFELNSYFNELGEYVYFAEEEIEEDLQIFTIVIKYIFDNGGIAFEPYGASVAKGSDFIRDVTSPEVAGYAPFRRIEQEYVDATVVHLEYYNIQSDITVNVIYEPTIVDFKVHHHLQHVDDDDYSLTYDYITQGKALTGSIVPDGLAYTEEELPGFKALTYEKLEVAADGSTVVEIRYDRNYYLVDFELAGGYGVEPIYTRFGAKIGANVPIKHGYLFDGWELTSYDGKTPTASQKSMYDINSSIIRRVGLLNLQLTQWFSGVKTQATTVLVSGQI